MKAPADACQLVGLAADRRDGVQTHSEGVLVAFSSENWRHGGRASAGWCNVVVLVVSSCWFIAPVVFELPTM